MDLYDVLGVPRTATQEEIKTAYHALARELHPDRTGGDEGKARRFRALTESYAVLGHEGKRRAYDKSRKGPAEGAAPRVDPRVQAAADRITGVVLEEAENLGQDAIRQGFGWLRDKVRGKLRRKAR